MHSHTSESWFCVLTLVFINHIPRLHTAKTYHWLQKNIPRVSFFISCGLAEPTNYVIGNITIYGNSHDVCFSGIS